MPPELNYTNPAASRIKPPSLAKFLTIATITVALIIFFGCALIQKGKQAGLFKEQPDTTGNTPSLNYNVPKSNVFGQHRMQSDIDSTKF